MTFGCAKEDKQTDNPLKNTCWTNADAKVTFAFNSETFTLYASGEENGGGTYGINDGGAMILNYLWEGVEEKTFTGIYTSSLIVINEFEKGEDVTFTKTTDCTGSNYLGK